MVYGILSHYVTGQRPPQQAVSASTASRWSHYPFGQSPIQLSEPLIAWYTLLTTNEVVIFGLATLGIGQNFKYSYTKTTMLQESSIVLPFPQKRVMLVSQVIQIGHWPGTVARWRNALLLMQYLHTLQNPMFHMGRRPLYYRLSFRITRCGLKTKWKEVIQNHVQTSGNYVTKFHKPSITHADPRERKAEDAINVEAEEELRI